MKRPTATSAILLCLVLWAWPSSARTETTYSYADLIRQLTDVSQLAVLPEAGETCRQWSSWDRSSRFDESTGKYVRWDANNDGPGFIRREGDQIVMAEMEGPGCIWRIWSAQAQEGHVKIYLDGREQPAVDLPFRNYFSGDTAPFNFPLLSYDLNRLGCSGQNLYFPIPYQKSCKIVADPKWGRYYQFVYRTYPAGTKLPTFSRELAAQYAEQLKSANDYFAQGLGTPHVTSPQEVKVVKELTVPARDKVEFTLDGPRAIVGLRGTASFANREDEMRALRNLVLQIQWDGESQPSVWCPLGDFFGTAPGVNRYRSLMTGLTEETAYAVWYMPFQKQAKLTLINEDSTERSFRVEILHAPLDRPFEGLGYFHCKWHRDVQNLPEDRWPDWMMLNTQGRGRYCGVMLHVWNPRGGWWGEGDEKFFVDGEKYPSTFGTGSEDYFGYAWCNPGLFQRPYHCQTMTMGNKGHQSVLRWHVPDNIPFQKSFEGCIEKYYRTEEKGTKYAVTVAWYLAPGGIDPYGPTPWEQRHNYYDNAPLIAGGFPVMGTPSGEVRTQGMRQYRGTWQDNDQLWWTGAKPGNKLELSLKVADAGTYQASGVFTKARDYGIVQLYLDGQKLGEPLDLYNPQVMLTDRLPLGKLDLAAGDHRITVEIIGANDKAEKAYMFGVDRIVLEKAK